MFGHHRGCHGRHSKDQTQFLPKTDPQNANYYMDGVPERIHPKTTLQGDPQNLHFFVRQRILATGVLISKEAAFVFAMSGQVGAEGAWWFLAVLVFVFFVCVCVLFFYYYYYFPRQAGVVDQQHPGLLGQRQL